VEQRIQTVPAMGKKKGVWQRLFTELGENPYLEYLISIPPLCGRTNMQPVPKKGERR
jgi:hypothetical protein